MSRLMFPPIGYPIAGILAAIVMRLAGFPPASRTWVTVGIGLLVLGGAGFAWAVVSQLRARTSPNPYSATSALVTDGPYRWSRNPIYVCDLVLQAGVTLVLTQAWGVLLLAPVFIGLRRVVVRFEEPYLRQLFPGKYETYVGQTRRWL